MKPNSLEMNVTLNRDEIMCLAKPIWRGIYLNKIRKPPPTMMTAMKKSIFKEISVRSYEPQQMR
ncbi:unnamed protein product [Clavelina lepadiformis]|uniref:Uncharacterized protein n=1 Tax=Clavelina lepadiformis TaxID=159417 RepID=A0ABP0F1X5_CLALP